VQLTEREGVPPEAAAAHAPHASLVGIAVAAVGVVALMVSLMLAHHLGPWGVIAAVSILFFGVFNWAFEPAG